MEVAKIFSRNPINGVHMNQKQMPEFINWTCEICGQLAPEGAPNVEVTYDYKSVEGMRTRVVWHRSCLDGAEKTD